MALADIMEMYHNNSMISKKVGLSEERIKAQIPVIRQYVAFWREYPDIFVEFLCGENNPENFHLYFYVNSKKTFNPFIRENIEDSFPVIEWRTE